ncbi:cilia- and flagella-associated protein 99 [Amphiprion ocellaris]|nr:cilia- and flagella-associated protein 99 [Amphiprion ocellaris]
MASSYGSLVKEAIVLLDKFRAGRQCLDDFIEGARKDLQLQDMDALQKKFILDVVSGCIEHKKLLDVVISAFYDWNGKRLSRGEDSQFVIICYLTTFTLDDLGLQNFSNIVRSLDIKKMHTFLSFFFSNLTTWIQEKWSSIYDAAFVEKHWIGPLLRWRPEIDILMDQLAVKISQKNQFKKAPVKTTEPQEFSLSKPKPRPLPSPEIFLQHKICKPVPNSTYRPPKEMQIIEEIKEKNHQKAEEHLYEANTKQFRCVNPHKSEHTKRVMSQIEEDFESKLKFNSFHSSAAPSTNKTNSSPIKLNKAAILRREALVDRQVEEELQRLERLMRGDLEQNVLDQMDPSFLQCQTERRYLEGRITEEEIALARQRITERNKKAAQLKKEETAQLMQRYAEKRLQEEKALRDLVQQVIEGHKNSKTAKEKLQKLKQSIVKEVSEQSQELLRQALEEAQEELSRKFEIIREIHAIESVPHMRVKNFDNTETAGHDLLGEMSLVELKERLNLLREAQQREQDEKRRSILEEKQKEKQQLQERLETIDLHGRALARAAAIRKEERKAKLESIKKAVAQDETLLELRKKLEEKKQERQRLKQSESSKATTSKQTEAHTVCNTTRHHQRSLKEKSWEELEQSLARYIQKAS